MPLTVPCPSCNDPQTVPDQAVGQTVRCQTCQTEFRAAAAEPAPPPWAPSPPRSRTLPVVLGLVALLAVGGVVAYFLLTAGTPTDYTDPDGVYSARFPDAPETGTLSELNPAMLKWGVRVARASAGGKEYSVTVIEGLNPGDQEVGPAGRDAQSNAALAIAIANADGEVLRQRAATHEGHAAAEVAVRSKEDGRLTAFRAVTGERYQVRMAVTGRGDKDKADAFLDAAAPFFDTVRLGPAFGPPILEDPPAVSAADLGAAYRADPKAADARYKGKWVRVTGPVTAVGAEGTTFEVDADGAVILVRRAARARLSVPVRKAGAAVTATGKVQGLEEPATGPGVRVVLDEAVVVRPPGSAPPSTGGPPPKK